MTLLHRTTAEYGKMIIADIDAFQSCSCREKHSIFKTNAKVKANGMEAPESEAL